MVCYPIYPQVTITNVFSNVQAAASACFTSPPPLPPADWAACLPARSASGPEVVTQQLVPRTPHLAVLPRSHTSVPEGAQQGRGKSSLLLPRAGGLLAAPFLSVACMDLQQVWEAKVGRQED